MPVECPNSHAGLENHGDSDVELKAGELFGYHSVKHH